MVIWPSTVLVWAKIINCIDVVETPIATLVAVLTSDLITALEGSPRSRLASTCTEVEIAAVRQCNDVGR